MRRERLRAAHDPTRLAQLYTEPHDHTKWGDHLVRVDVTVAIGTALARPAAGFSQIADLSCGNGQVAKRIPSMRAPILGDLAPGYDICGSIEHTINVIEPVNLFICSETLEHLDDPDTVLAKIRAKTDYLLLSTPESEFGSNNAEHYWAWDSEAVKQMLLVAGFTPKLHTILDCYDYGVSYQIWGCR